MLKFTRKAAGVHTAKVTNDLELALTNAGSVYGWHITLRDANTRKITKRLASQISTLGQAKATAGTLANSPQFAALLLNIA